MDQDQLATELVAIRDRNKRVEIDKAWEISWTRRIFIIIFTYVIAGFWLWLIHDNFPWLKAFVPAGGYLLSTFSLPVAKKWWIGYHN